MWLVELETLVTGTIATPVARMGIGTLLLFSAECLLVGEGENEMIGRRGPTCLGKKGKAEIRLCWEKELLSSGLEQQPVLKDREGSDQRNSISQFLRVKGLI